MYVIVNSCLEKSIDEVFCIQPKVVTATDEADLARQMEKAEAENTEVAGDDDEDEEDEENGENHKDDDDDDTDMDEDTE